MSSKARVSVAIVRPTCPFFPRDWNNQPQTGEVQKIEPAVSLRIAQGVVSAYNRLKLADAGNDARRRRQVPSPSPVSNSFERSETRQVSFRWIHAISQRSSATPNGAHSYESRHAEQDSRDHGQQDRQDRGNDRHD